MRFVIRALPIVAPALLVGFVALPALAQAQPSLSVDLGGGVKLELVLVARGKFVQGSAATEPGRGDDEAQREVTISRDFYMGKFLVTRGQFTRFTAETSYRTEAERGSSGGSGWD